MEKFIIVIMYAVIQTGGKQYRVSEGERLRVERIPGQPGEILSMNRVLMVGGNGNEIIGRPFLDNASVEAEILEQGRAKKVIVFKKKRRKKYWKKQGHRQDFTLLAIKEIRIENQ